MISMKPPAKKWKPEDCEKIWYVVLDFDMPPFPYHEEFTEGYSTFNVFRTKSAALKAAKEVKALLKKLPKE